MRILSRKRNFFCKRKGLFKYPFVYGEISIGDIQIYKSNEKNDIILEIKSSLMLKGNLSLQEETSFFKIKKAFGTEDILIGDDDFDKAFLIQAEKNFIAYAILSCDVRKKLLSMIKQYSFELTDSYFKCHFSSDEIQSYKDLDNIIILVVSLYDDLLSDLSRHPILRYKKRLIHNILNDPLSSVRENNILAIGSHLRIDDEVDEALTTVMNHDNEAVNRLRAAQLLKSKGLQYMELLLQQKINDELKCEIIQYFHKMMYRESILLLKKICNIQSDFVKREIVIALLSLEVELDLSFYAPYLNFINHDKSLSLLKLFGEKGTLDTVEFIYMIGKVHGDNDIRNEANRAIAMIQSRLGSGDRGWVSIQDNDIETGSLSFDNSPESGAVTLDDNDKDSQ